jgi:hypothetical protein
MEKQRGIVWPLVVHLDSDRFAAIGTGRFDAAVSMQRAEYAKRVPRTVCVPPAVGSVNTIGGRHSREWACHPDLRRGRVESERVRIMQAAPPAPHLVVRRSREACDLGSRRSVAELNKLTICEVPEVDVELVDGPIVTPEVVEVTPVAVLGEMPSSVPISFLGSPRQSRRSASTPQSLRPAGHNGRFPIREMPAWALRKPKWRIGSGAGIRTLNLAVNRSLKPDQ